MKTIFYIGNFSAPDFNAAGKRVYGNGKIFQELGYKVVFIGCGNAKKILYDNMLFYSLNKSYNVISMYFKICNIISNETIDKSEDNLIIFYGSISLVLLNFMLLKYAKKKKFKTITDCPDWITDRSNNHVYNIIRTMDYNFEKRVFNKKVDNVLLISSYLKQYYKKIATIIIPPLNLYNTNDIKISNNQNIQFVYAGIPFRLGQNNIKPNQMKDRLDLIIDLFYMVYQTNDNFDFDIYGITKNEYLKAIPRHKKILDELNNIRFNGKLKSIELQKKIALADYTILLRDRRKETMAGFSTKISESMSLYTPVITNDTSDVKKYIKNDINGYVLDNLSCEKMSKTILFILSKGKNNIKRLKEYNKNNQMFYYGNYFQNIEKLRLKKKVMLVFSEGGENGGPFVSHKRIMESKLMEKFEFTKLIIPKGRLKLFNFKLCVNLRNQIKKEKPDIIQCNGLQLQGFHCMLAAFLEKVPKRIVAIHGSSLESTSFSKLKKFILNIVEQLTLLLATDFFGVSDYVTNWERLKKFKKKNYGTIYNLPPKISNNIVRGKIRKEFNINKDCTLIISTGRITAEKGFDTMIDVIKNINNDKICFLIVGDGDYKKHMENSLKKEIANKKVIFTGYREDIPNLLIDSDIFILLTHHETLSISLLEATKCNLPMIATNVGGIPEIIENNYNGFLVDNYSSSDAIEKINILVNNCKLRKRMANNSKNRFDDRFNRNIILNKLKKLYKGVEK